MKCSVCGAMISDNKRFCPGCGRVISEKERRAVAAENGGETDGGTRIFPAVKPGDSPASGKTTVFRPAAAKQDTGKNVTARVPDIFNSDPNAPEYIDPHSYDRATADALEYDRVFLRGEASPEEVYSEPERVRIYPEPQPEYEDEQYYEEDYEEAPVRERAAKKAEKSPRAHLNFNKRLLAVFLAVIVGIAICVTGIYQIGKQFGFWGEQPSTPGTQGGTRVETTTDEADGEQTTAKPEAPTGAYTVTSSQRNIFMYKEDDGRNIIATIPADTVITITEISDTYGKTSYNSYSGWISLDDAEYTPQAAPEPEDTEPDETVAQTQSQYPTEPGNYTVNMQGDGTAVNVRSEPSTNGDILTALNEGTAVTVEEVTSGWGRITIDGTQGWIYMRYLTAE